MIRTAAVLAWLAGVGFGLPGAYGLWFFAERGFALPFGPPLGLARTALVVAHLAGRRPASGVVDERPTTPA